MKDMWVAAHLHRNGGRGVTGVRALNQNYFNVLTNEVVFPLDLIEYGQKM